MTDKALNIALIVGAGAGLSASLPGQKGQGPAASPDAAGGSPLRGRTSAARSGAMITQRRRMGSRRSSDMCRRPRRADARSS